MDNIKIGANNATTYALHFHRLKSIPNKWS
jgi:hypothetical protein